MSGEAPGSRASPHTDESPVNQRPGGRGPRRRLPHDDRGPPGWPGSRLFIWGFGQPPPPPQPPAKVLKSTVSLDQIQLLAFFFFFFKNKLCSTDLRHSVGENWTEPSGRPGALWHLRRGQAQPGAFPHGGARDSAVPAGGLAACWPRAVPAATEQTGNRGPDAPQGPRGLPRGGVPHSSGTITDHGHRAADRRWTCAVHGLPDCARRPLSTR